MAPRSSTRRRSVAAGGQSAPARPQAKDLIGIPWRVAFALQADGWYLRQDIIWSKPNPMPESVRDRCTKAHEYLFLLSKGPRYHFDAEAIAEPLRAASVARWRRTWRRSRIGPRPRQDQRRHEGGRQGKRNKTFKGGGAYTQGQSFDNSADAERDSHGNAPNESGTRNRAPSGPSPPSPSRKPTSPPIRPN
jgi:hypothetical protein